MVGVWVDEGDGLEAGAVAVGAEGLVVRTAAGAGRAEAVVPGVAVEGVMGLREVGVGEHALDSRDPVDTTAQVFALAPRQVAHLGVSPINWLASTAA